jgi:hypothetical protein
MNNEKSFIVAVCISAMSLISAITFYNFSELTAKRANIETAISKGIDPITVRCAYSGSTDMICVAYAAQKPK